MVRAELARTKLKDFEFGTEMDIRAATRKAMKTRVREVETREAARQHHARSIIGRPDAYLRVTETGYNLHQKDPDNLLPNR